MTHQLDTTDGSSAQERIAADHRRLRTLLAKLGESRHADEFSPLIAELRTILERHFAEEEAPSGLPHLVRHHAPNQMRKLEQLFAEHRTILESLDVLEKQIAVCREAHQRLYSHTQGLISTLEEHEAQENELVSDALLVDFGGGD